MNQQNQPQNSETKKSAPQLTEIVKILQEEHSHRWDLLGSIQDKLHNILDLRSPQDGSDISSEDPSPSIINDLNKIVNAGSHQNEKLIQILNHLEKITH